VKKSLLLLTVILLSALGLEAQSAPPQLPGFGVSAYVGYTGVTNQGLGSGVLTSFAAPIYTNPGFASGPLKNDAMTVSGRIDNVFTTSPGGNVLTGGPEFRFQFSSATFLDGKVFQPFVNVGVGAARSSCVATSACPVGTDTTTHFAYKFGVGIDTISSTHVIWRLLEYDRVQSKFFPGNGVTLSNANQFITSIGFRF